MILVLNLRNKERSKVERKIGRKFYSIFPKLAYNLPNTIEEKKEK